MHRQRRSRKYVTLTQKKLDVIARISDREFKSASNKSKADALKQNLILVEQEVKELIVEMDVANDQDV
jgi:hypothetical protein